ncbi:uncharacterized protein LOC144575300 isoform X1 [Carex rostrata]
MTIPTLDLKMKVLNTSKKKMTPKVPTLVIKLVTLMILNLLLLPWRRSGERHKPEEERLLILLLEKRLMQEKRFKSGSIPTYWTAPFAFIPCAFQLNSVRMVRWRVPPAGQNYNTSVTSANFRY